MAITFKEILENKEFKTYIKKGNEILGILGYTDHSATHTLKVAEAAADILQKLGHAEREIELAQIASYIHDIGNVINRHEHAHTGAIMAMSILENLGMDFEEIATIITAIGNHDEETGQAVNAVSAALILADKTDVRRSRVRNTDFATFDIHDRVNYAVEKSDLKINAEDRTIVLDLKLDVKICSLMDYFEIFLKRMLMCIRAAEFLKMEFHLVVNGTMLS